MLKIEVTGLLMTMMVQRLLLMMMMVQWLLEKSGLQQFVQSN
jgi:hypothetical protein